MADTVSMLRAATRFIATVGAATFVGTVVALAASIAADPAPADIRSAIRVLPEYLRLSAPLVAVGLLLFGLPTDWALRRGRRRHWLNYAAAGAIGGLAGGYLTAFLMGGFAWHRMPGTFALVGLDYGLVSALIFWLIFRRGAAPAAEAAATI